MDHMNSGFRGILVAATRDEALTRQVGELGVPGVAGVEVVASGRALMKKLAPEGLLPHEADGGLIRIALVDDDLTDMRGRDLVPRLRRARGDLKIIFVARRGDEEVEIRVRQEGIYFFLVKPISTEILGKVAAKAIEHESTSRQVGSRKAVV